MNLKEFANILNGKQYEYPQFTEKEIQIAKDNNFVIVYGASDDLMEFDGAFTDEGNCFDGGTVWFNEKQVIDDDVATTEDKCIEALWCDDNATDENGNIITWTYKTNIPHETFMIYEEDKAYCRGLVFELNKI